MYNIYKIGYKNIINNNSRMKILENIRYFSSASIINRCSNSYCVPWHNLEFKSVYEYKAINSNFHSFRRYASKYQNATTTPIAANQNKIYENNNEFMLRLTELMRDLHDYANEQNSFEAANWLKRALQYNLPKGKKYRGLLTVSAYKNLVKDLTSDNLKLIMTLGWCVEMLQCYFLLCDDIMDNSSTRRGQTCWYKLPEVGLIAVNDAFMIEGAIYYLLKKYFRQHSCYVPLLELFHEVSFITTCGQSLDLLNANNMVTSFTLDKYKAVVANKTSIYTFYLPCALAMHLAGIKNPEAFRACKALLLEMGYFFQVQDDYLDCFGNSDVTGKVGTDIQDNKCTWLAVKCMQQVDDEQKLLMLQSYGRNEEHKVAAVKNLYNILDLPNAYKTFEREMYEKIRQQIEAMSEELPKETFLQTLDMLYQRNA